MVRRGFVGAVFFILSLLPLVLILMFLLEGSCHFSGFGYSYDAEINTTFPNPNLVCQSLGEVTNASTGVCACDVSRDGGFQRAWRVLNWHPLLMTVGFAVCFFNAAIAFRQRLFGAKRSNRKVAHATLNTLAFVLSTLGIVDIFIFKQSTGNADLYTAHAVVGFVAYAAFALQWAISVCSFCCGSPAFKASFVVVHRIVGSGLLVMTTAAMISGLLGYSWVMYYSVSGQFPNPTPDFKAPVRGFMYTIGDAYSMAVVLSICIVIALLTEKSSTPVAPIEQRLIQS